jgi:hypothetical protein
MKLLFAIRGSGGPQRYVSAVNVIRDYSSVVHRSEESSHGKYLALSLDMTHEVRSMASPKMTGLYNIGGELYSRFSYHGEG